MTSDNVHLYKGQHVQVIQKLNNDQCIVQLLNNLELASPTNNNNNNSNAATSVTSGNSSSNTSGKPQQVIEVQIPISLIKSRSRNVNNSSSNYDGNNATTFLIIYFSFSTSLSCNFSLPICFLRPKSEENEDPGKSAAAKRKGSFKKWLRSSHRKLTSNANQRSGKDVNGTSGGPSGGKLLTSEIDSLKIKVKRKFLF